MKRLAPQARVFEISATTGAGRAGGRAVAGGEAGRRVGDGNLTLEAVEPPMSDSTSTRRLAITVQGIVQGVGFRPFVYNLARGAQLDRLGA